MIVHISGYLNAHPHLKLFGQIWLLTTLLSTAATLLINPTWGFYDSFMAVLASDNTTGFYINESFHLGLSPTYKALRILHTCFSSLPWAGVMMFLCWIYIQSLSVYMIAVAVGIDRYRLRSLFLIWALLLIFIWGFSFIEYSFTGMGILMSFISLVAIHHVWSGVTSDRRRWLLSAILSIGFIAGFCLRIESGLGGSLMGVLFILMRERSLIRLLKMSVFPLLFSSAFFLRFYMVLGDHYYFKTVDPIVFYVTDSHNSPPLAGRDSNEAVKIKLIKASFLIDSAQFNYDIYSRLAQQKWQYEKAHTLKPLEACRQIYQVASPTIKTNLPLTFIYLLIGAIVLLSTVFSAQRKGFYIALTFNSTFILIIAVLSYSMKMEKWHYVPLIQTALLCNLLYLSHTFDLRRYRQGIVIRLALVVIAAVLVTGYIVDIRANHKNIEEKKQIASGIFAGSDDKVIFLDVNTREVLDDFVYSRYTRRTNIYFYDMCQFDYLTETENRLNHLCGCNAHSAKDFFEYLKKNSANIDYYSTPPRVSLLSEFMDRIYGIKVVFRAVKETPLKNNHYGLESIVQYKIEFPQ